MGAKRRASAYSRKNPVVNTRRSKKLSLSYVKTVPPQKIVKFNMGNYQKFESGGFPIMVAVVVNDNLQIRDLALEAARQSLNKDLTKLLQKEFFLRCNLYPHNILRNNRVFSGGSKGERIQTGMSKSFGKSEGRAGTIKKGNPVFSAYFSGESNIPKVKEFFRKIRPKLPGNTGLITEIKK
jgi:ribosomal protein L10e